MNSVITTLGVSNIYGSLKFTLDMADYKENAPALIRVRVPTAGNAVGA